MKNTTARKKGGGSLGVESWSDGEGWTEDQVVLHFQYWVVSVMNRATMNLPRHIYLRHVQDMRQNALLALVLRWRVYQSRKIEIPFTAYAWLNVRGAVVDTFRDRRKDTVFTCELIYVEQDFLDTLLEHDSDKGSLCDKQIDLYQKVLQLNSWERNFLTLFFFEGQTLKHIGDLGGVTESRACQVKSAILEKLRASFDQ